MKRVPMGPPRQRKEVAINPPGAEAHANADAVPSDRAQVRCAGDLPTRRALR